MKESLSVSRMSCLLDCPRKHFFRYEVGIEPERDAVALTFGKGWHAAMEARWQGQSFDDALAAGVKTAVVLEEFELAVLSGLLAGYYARYGGAEEIVKTLHPEVEFRMPVEESRTFEAYGFIDGLGVLVDDRLALIEHKTTGSSLDSGADYWMRLRFNQQVLSYVLAARALDWDVSTILYDVVRKPMIKVRQNETLPDFARRLTEDCAARPEFYFARREIPILESDLQEFQIQRAEIARLVLAFRGAARRAARPDHGWPRHVGFNCDRCEYAGPCLSNITIDPSLPPAGFRPRKQRGVIEGESA